MYAISYAYYRDSTDRCDRARISVKSEPDWSTTVVALERSQVVAMSFKARSFCWPRLWVTQNQAEFLRLAFSSRLRHTPSNYHNLHPTRSTMP
jgi:hypothetical protein